MGFRGLFRSILAFLWDDVGVVVEGRLDEGVVGTEGNGAMVEKH
jgi:hypothetical protein